MVSETEKNRKAETKSKTKTGNKAKAKTKTPSGLLYFICYLLLYPFLKVFFRLKVDRSCYSLSKGPCIVLANHQSFMDFILTMLTVYPRRLNAVAAQKFFYYSPLDKLLPAMWCIPKCLFDPDPRTISRCIDVVSRGGSLLLFPEGRCSYEGTYIGMHKATGKLIRKLGVPVVSCHVEGSYFCMPIWRKGFRLGRLRVTLANLFSAEDTQIMEVEELNRRIDTRLSGADTLPPVKPFRVFRARRLAEGLENILYYCANCKSEFTLETDRNIIRCSACGSFAEIDCYERLKSGQGSGLPETVQEWFREQVAHEMRSLEGLRLRSIGMGHVSGENRSEVYRVDSVDDADSADNTDKSDAISSMPPESPIKLAEVQVILRMKATVGKGLEQCGRGKLVLDSKGWHFTGELRAENVNLFFPIDTVPAIPFDPNDNFQIYSDGVYYAFTPCDNPRACAKYAIIGECAYWRYAREVKMTVQGEA